MTTILTGRRRLRAVGAAALVLAFGAVLPARAFNPQPDPPGRASLVGRVTDAATSRAIDGATITLSPTSGETNPPEPDRTTTTNNGGHYLFQGLPGGDYAVTVQACGYQPFGGPTTTDSSPTTVHINSRGVSHLDISLNSIAPPDPCRG